MRHLSAAAQAWIGLIRLGGGALLFLAVAEWRQVEADLPTPTVAVLLIGADIVQRVVEAFAEQASLSGHTLPSDGIDAPLVFADPPKVERILRNLVSNALKYSPRGGPIHILAAERTPGEVEVCWRIPGLGIPHDWLDRLFERFQRVDMPDRASIRGTGLGRYIARQLVVLTVAESGQAAMAGSGVDVPLHSARRIATLEGHWLARATSRGAPTTTIAPRPTETRAMYSIHAFCTAAA